GALLLSFVVVFGGLHTTTNSSAGARRGRKSGRGTAGGVADRAPRTRERDMLGRFFADDGRACDDGGLGTNELRRRRDRLLFRRSEARTVGERDRLADDRRTVEIVLNDRPARYRGLGMLFERVRRCVYRRGRFSSDLGG